MDANVATVLDWVIVWIESDYVRNDVNGFLPSVKAFLFEQI